MPRRPDEQVRPRGRPRKDDPNPALVASQRKPSRNVTLDADLVEDMNRVADGLAAEFGFRPTLSQVVRHLIKRALA